jgi:hypothetical protein
MSRLRGRYASGIYGAENVFEFRFNLIMMCHGMREKFSSGKHIRPHKKIPTQLCSHHQSKMISLNFLLPP